LIEERDHLQKLLDKIDNTVSDVLIKKFKLSMNSQVIEMHAFTETQNLEKIPKQNKPRNFFQKLGVYF
jgi:hypothetical protein